MAIIFLGVIYNMVELNIFTAACYLL